MTFEAAILLGLALIAGALIYAIALILTMQTMIERAAEWRAESASDPLPAPAAVPMPKRKPGRKPKPAPTVEPAQVSPQVVGIEIDPRQLTIKP
jgi:hypothetical protein